MDEYLNELIAYLVIGAGAIFVGVAGFVSVRRRLRIVRSTRRHRRSSARLPERPSMVVVPAEETLPEPSPSTPSVSVMAAADPADVPAADGLDFFDAFEDRLAQIRAEIDALDTSPAH